MGNLARLALRALELALEVGRGGRELVDVHGSLLHAAACTGAQSQIVVQWCCFGCEELWRGRKKNASGDLNSLCDTKLLEDPSAGSSQGS